MNLWITQKGEQTSSEQVAAQESSNVNQYASMDGVLRYKRAVDSQMQMKAPRIPLTFKAFPSIGQY